VITSAVQKYSFINAKLRTRISKLLSEETYDALIRAPSMVEAVQLLKNTPYTALETIYSKTGDIKSAELELYKAEIAIFHDVERRVDGDTRLFCSALTTYYEVENVKRAVRLWFDRAIRGRDIEDSRNYLYRETIHYPLSLDAIIQAADYSGVVEALKDSPYAQFFGESVPDIQKMNSLFAFEIALDKYYYSQLRRAVDNLSTADARVARRLIGVEVDLLNINRIIRFKTIYNLPLQEALKYSIPYGYELDKEAIARAYNQDRVSEVFDALMKKHKGLSAMLKEREQDSSSRLEFIEQVLEFVIMREVKRMLVGNPFSIGIILAYFILKKNELKKIMTILNAKYYMMNPEEIKGRL
jgi:V/A-type H+-transporting ATPase subunit C